MVLWFTANEFNEGMEKDLEVMEPVALSDPPEQSFEVEKEVSWKGGNILVTMWEKLFAFKRVVEDQLVQFFRGRNLETTRAYQVWPGKNVSLFTM